MEKIETVLIIPSLNPDKTLLQVVDLAVSMQAAGEYGAPVPDYRGENVSVKVVRLIQSYTGVVNRMVWRKDS